MQPRRSAWWQLHCLARKNPRPLWLHPQISVGQRPCDILNVAHRKTNVKRGDVGASSVRPRCFAVAAILQGKRGIVRTGGYRIRPYANPKRPPCVKGAPPQAVGDCGLAHESTTPVRLQSLRPFGTPPFAQGRLLGGCVWGGVPDAPACGFSVVFSETARCHGRI